MDEQDIAKQIEQALAGRSNVVAGTTTGASAGQSVLIRLSQPINGLSYLSAQAIENLQPGNRVAAFQLGGVWYAVGEQRQGSEIKAIREVRRRQRGTAVSGARYTSVNWDYDTLDKVYFAGSGRIQSFPFASIDPSDVSDLFYFHAKSRDQVWAISTYINNLGPEYVYLADKTIQEANFVNAVSVSRALRLHYDAYQAGPYFTMALENEPNDPSFLGWARYNLIDNSWVTGTFNVSIYTDGWPRFIEYSGSYEFFDGITRPESYRHDYSISIQSEAVSGVPWPTPGVTYEYNFFRHFDSPSQTFQAGTPWPTLANTCDPDYFEIYRGDTYQPGIGNTTPWQSGVPVDANYAGLPNLYFFTLTANTFSPIYDASNNPIPNVIYRSGGSVSLRQGNLFFFTILESYNASLQAMRVSAVYPDPPVLPAQFRQNLNSTLQSSAFFTQVYSDIDPCKEPPPPTRSVTRRTNTRTRSHWQPISRNENYGIYMEAVGIEYFSERVQANGYSIGGIEYAAAQDDVTTSWSIQSAGTYRHNFATGERERVNNRKNVSLPAPNPSLLEVGSSYTVNYSDIDGSVYSYRVKGVNTGSSYKDNLQAPPGNNVQMQCNAETQAYWASIASADIPVWGVSYNVGFQGGTKAEVIWKGRVTSLSYDASQTSMPRGFDDAHAAIEIFSFTYIVDEILCYASGYSGIPFVDIYSLNRESGSGKSFRTTLLFNNGSLGVTTLFADQTTPETFVTRNLRLTGNLFDWGTRDVTRLIFDSSGYTLAHQKLQWISDTEFFLFYRRAPANELYLSYDVEFPLPIQPSKSGRFAPVVICKMEFNQSTNEWDVFLDRIEAIPTDITTEQFEGPPFYFIYYDIVILDYKP